jgi:hypothetical protein
MDVNTNERFTVEFAESGTRTTRVVDNVGTTPTETKPRVPPQQIVPTGTAPPAIIAAWGGIRQARMSSEMYEKLLRLASVAPGWRGPGAQSMKVSSLNQFLHFWSLIRDDAVEPELALAPDGSIHAEWFKSIRQRLDIRFADANVRFGMFTNNNILEGADKLATVAQILKDHHAKPLTWQPK